MLPTEQKNPEENPEEPHNNIFNVTKYSEKILVSVRCKQQKHRAGEES